MNFDGQILDCHTGLPVAGAEIRCFGPGGKYVKTTNNAGYFSISGLEPGRWCLSVLKLPYAPLNCRSMLAGSDMFVNIYLELEHLKEENITA